jgi:hypothetical protein
VNRQDVVAQSVHRRRVCFPPGPDSNVDRWSNPKCWKQLDAGELAQTPLESVAIDGRVLVSGDHDPNAGKAKRGSEDSDIEMRGPNSLPLSNDGL